MAEMLGRKVYLTDGSGVAVIEDVAIERNRLGEWDIGQLFLRRPKTSASPFAKGPTTFAEWSEVRETQMPGEAQSAEQLVATFSELKAADLANTLLDLPEDRLIEVAEELPDDRLADALEEMPEEDQVHILEALGDERAADILDAMEPDDAADVLGQLSEDRLEELLDLMEPEEAEDVRALLKYGADTAGGLMTPEPIVLSADATVAEALALIRRHELHPALAAAVFVTLPPYETPTGRLLGTVHFQRMLRYPPHERLGAIIDDTLDPVPASASAAEVARLLASYNLVSLPVVDQARRLVGAVSVDDVLDYLLPEDWRSHDADDDRPDTVPHHRPRAYRGGADGPADPPDPARRSSRPLGHAGTRAPQPSSDRFGRFSESFARAMGTSGFLIGMTIFVLVWLAWNTFAPRAAAVRPARVRTSRC